SDVIREITGCPDIKNGGASLVVALGMLFHRCAAPQPAEPVKRKRRYAQGTALGEYGVIPMCDQVDDEPVKVPSDEEIEETLNLESFVDRRIADDEMVLVSMGRIRAAFSRYGQPAASAELRCRKCGERANVAISSASLVAHWSDGTPRDERDIASDPEGKLIHDPSESLRAAPVAAQGRPKRRPYNTSGSLSEYGVFPECDAAPVAAQAQPSGNPGELPVVNQQMTTD